MVQEMHRDRSVVVALKRELHTAIKRGRRTGQHKVLSGDHGVSGLLHDDAQIRCLAVSGARNTQGVATRSACTAIDRQHRAADGC